MVCGGDVGSSRRRGVVRHATTTVAAAAVFFTFPSSSSPSAWIRPRQHYPTKISIAEYQIGIIIIVII